MTWTYVIRVCTASLYFSLESRTEICSNLLLLQTRHNCLVLLLVAIAAQICASASQKLPSRLPRGVLVANNSKERQGKSCNRLELFPPLLRTPGVDDDDLCHVTIISHSKSRGE